MENRKRASALYEVWGDPLQTLVPEGDYWVRHVGWERGTAYGGERWFAWMVIEEDGPYRKLPILRFYNPPTGPRIALSSNLAVDFVRIHGHRPPPDLHPHDLLDGQTLKVEVTTVRAASDGKSKIQIDESDAYSKVNRILAVRGQNAPPSQEPFGVAGGAP